jgi:SET domain-containing protein
MRPDSDPNDPSHTFLFELEDSTVIDASIGGDAARWVNHSCTPNCETYEDAAGLIFIRARRRILPGEELTYDYCLTIPGKLSKRELARYACRCLAVTCRGSLVATKKRR